MPADKFDPVRSECGICGSGNIALYHVDSDGIRIFKCRVCGIQFMNPQYSDQFLREFYSHYISMTPEADEAVWDDLFRYSYNFTLSLLERYTTPPGTLLDIGCGKGHLMLAAKERGWSPTGYDVDCPTTQQVSKTIGMQVLCGDFLKIGWSPESFDVVSMHHVVEHLKSPLPYLNIARSILRSGGILFLALPNIRSLASTVKFYLEKMRIKRKNVGAYYDTGHHLWYYTPSTMRHVLGRFGFEVLHVRSGHRIRPEQTRLQRVLARNFIEKIPWRSTFLVIARKS